MWIAILIRFMVMVRPGLRVRVRGRPANARMHASTIG